MWDRALREYDDIDLVHVLARGGQEPLDQRDIERFRGLELEKPVGFYGPLVYRTGQRTKVLGGNAERPRE
jgi:hypothetical protein